jgi:hypothetical protein
VSSGIKWLLAERYGAKRQCDRTLGAPASRQRRILRERDARAVCAQADSHGHILALHAVLFIHFMIQLPDLLRESVPLSLKRSSATAP